MRYTFDNLIMDTLNKSDVPLSANEIWEKAEEWDFAKQLESKGKTPWQTIAAKIYVDMKKPGSNFAKISSRPARFGVKSKSYTNVVAPVNANSHTTYSEGDLHPLLVKFVYADAHFKCYSKTINHSKSMNKVKGRNKWLHPDIVGVHFPFEDYNAKTLKVIAELKENAVKVFSFEMKKEIDFTYLREYYFQAVSNSSWANEGYLVAIKYSEDVEFVDEMQRLNNAFGIGFIKLDAQNIEQSEIILPAKNKNIDWETVNRLVEENSDFSEFVEDVADDIDTAKVRGKYDKVLDDNEYNTYIQNKKIQ